MYVRWRLVVLVCVQSALRVATLSVLLGSHTWLVLELSHGGMGSLFGGHCRQRNNYRTPSPDFSCQFVLCVFSFFFVY